MSSLREYIRHFPQDAADANDGQAVDLFLDDDALLPNDIEDFDSDEDPMDARPLLDDEYDALPGIHRPRPNDLPPYFGDDVQNHVRAPAELDPDIDDEVLDEVDELVRDTIDDIAGADDSDVENVDHNPMLTEDSDDDEGPDFANHALDRDRHLNVRFPPGSDDEPFHGSDSEYLEDDHFPDQQLNVAVVGHIGDDDPEELDDMNNDGLDDHDDQDGRGDGGALFGLFELDPDEVPLEEVVGLRGHIRNLFDNACTVLVSNAVFLGVFTLIPLLIGRLTLRLFSMQSFPLRFVLASDEVNALPWGVLSLLQASMGGMPTQIMHAVHNASALLTANLSAESTGIKMASAEFSLAPSSNTLNEVADSASSLSDAYTGSLVASPIPSHIYSPSPTTMKMDQPLGSYVDNFLIVLLGYGMIALIAVAYIGVMSMLRQRYPRLDSPLTRQIARMLRYIATFVKIVVLILFEFGIFPLGCGWWLDICTLDILGGSLPSRLAYCHDSPWTCTGVHWIMGIIYMVHISLFISLLREVVRPELLWFLRNPDDPEFHPFRELVEKPLSRHARRMCISVVIYVPLILALVYVPGQMCLELLPSVFPFRSEDFSHILIDVPFGNLLVGPLIRLLYFGRPEVSLQKVVAAWVQWVSTSLGVAHLVVKDDDRYDGLDGPVDDDAEGIAVGLRDGGPLHRMLGNDVADGDVQLDGDMYVSDDHMEGLEGEEDEDAMDEGRGWIRLRVAIMIMAAWVTLIVVQSALISIPTVIGRWLMGAVGLPVRHDLHPFLLGLNILLGCISGAFKLAKYIQTLGTVAILSMGLPYVVIAAKGAVILVIWLGVIPLATGLLFELTLMPIRVGQNETPYFCMHQDWAMGLLLLKVWACIAMTGGLGAKWRERVLRAREGDVLGLDQNFGRSMREVFLPLLVSVLTALSVPYSFARGLLPFLGVTRWVSNLVYRYVYLVIAWVYCGMETMRYSICMLRDLHDSIRDDKYLMGKKLYNFMEGSDMTARATMAAGAGDGAGDGPDVGIGADADEALGEGADEQAATPTN